MVEFRPYVYFENILVVNLALNGLIIWVTGNLAGCKNRPWRLGLSASVGALFSFAVLYPELNWSTGFVVKMFLSLVMMYVAFGRLPLRRFAACVMYFYLVSFVLGGAVMAIAFNSNGLFGNFNLARILPDIGYILVSVFILGSFLAHWGSYVMKSRIVQNWFKFQMTIQVQNQQVSVRALVDTGNQLRDPLSGWPVLVVEKSAISGLLPEGLMGILEGEVDYDCLMKQQQEGWIERIKLIPFNSLGAKNGLLLGFRPDKVVVMQEGSEQVLERVIIGVTEETLSPQGNYQALLHPDILHGSMTV